jgi:hypothetical protein
LVLECATVTGNYGDSAFIYKTPNYGDSAFIYKTPRWPTILQLSA